MMDFFNSDFAKLAAILISLIALVYIGLKHKPVNSTVKSLHIWYISGISVFLIIELITYIVVENTEAQNIMNYISFASTLASLILSVLAIFMTVLSGESMNKLRDSILGLSNIPKNVNDAVNSTIERMQQSTKNLSLATESNNEAIKKLHEEIDKKIKEMETHLLCALDLHQQNTLNAINNNFLENKNGGQQDSKKISHETIDFFLESTSNASISLLYFIEKYCIKSKEVNMVPEVNLKELADKINSGKKDEGFYMYLFACLVLLSAFGLLGYDTVENQLSVVRFYSIDSTLSEKLNHQLQERKITDISNKFCQYINALFNNIKDEGTTDGSEADSN